MLSHLYDQRESGRRRDGWPRSPRSGCRDQTPSTQFSVGRSPALQTTPSPSAMVGAYVRLTRPPHRWPSARPCTRDSISIPNSSLFPLVPLSPPFQLPLSFDINLITVSSCLLPSHRRHRKCNTQGPGSTPLILHLCHLPAHLLRPPSVRALDSSHLDSKPVTATMVVHLNFKQSIATLQAMTALWWMASE